LLWEKATSTLTAFASRKTASSWQTDEGILCFSHSVS